MGQQIDQGQQQNEFTQYGHKDGTGRVADGDKGHLTGDLQPKQEQGAAVKAQGAGREGDQFRVRREHAGEQLGEEHDRRPQQGGVDQADDQQQAEAGPHPLAVPGPVVVAGDGLGPLGDALKGQHGELHHAGQDGHGPHRRIPAVFQQGRVEAHGDDALAALHDEGGQP